MASLVSQDEALRQLRMIAAALTADQLADVNFKAEVASALVVDYLKRPFNEGPLVVNPLRVVAPPVAAPDDAPDQSWTDTPPPAMLPPGFYPDAPLDPSVPPDPPPAWTPNNVPILVKGMILTVLTALHDGRTPDDALLSDAVTSALWRMRDPALA